MNQKKNITSLIGQYENRLKAILGILSMAFLVYSGTVLLRGYRLDFTEEGLYTLSTGTEKILSRLEQPVRLKLYYSKTAANKGTEGIRAFNNYFEYIVVLLERMKAVSQNNIKLEVIDPRPDTPEEEDAILYGLRRFNLTDTEKYFFGLVAQSEAGEEKVIEFFDPNQKERLEYDLVRLIYQVTQAEKVKIGLLSPIPVKKEDVSPYLAQIMRMQGKPVEGSWGITRMAEELYEIQVVNKEKPDLSFLKGLIVIHPSGFSEELLYQIDQYVMKGGKLIVFTDPFLAMANRLGPEVPSSSPDKGFNKLLSKWGFTLKKDTFVGDKYLTQVGQYAPNTPPTRLLPVVECDQRCVSATDDPISSGLNRSRFIFPGPISVEKREGVTYAPLIQTTDKGNEYTARSFQLNNPVQLWRDFKEGSKPQAFAYKAIGRFESSFEGAPKVKKDGKEKNKKKKGKSSLTSNEASKNNHLEKSQEDSAIIVFNDVDFLTDQYAFQNTFLGMAVANDNSTLFLNALEALAGDLNLLQVRSKGKKVRGFDVVDQIEFEAERDSVQKVKEINQSIAKFQAELNQLGQKANGNNMALIQNEGLKKRKELNKKIVLLKKQLRSVKREGREKVESLGRLFMVLNTMLVPILLACAGLVYLTKRKNLTQGKRKRAPNYAKNIYHEEANV